MKPNWELLREIRSVYLGESGNIHSPWTPESLEQYDFTFGRRIFWKWEYVLGILKNHNWNLPFSSLEVVDFGCGTGVASEAYLTHFPPPQQLALIDRSSAATAFSFKKLTQSHPSVSITIQPSLAPERESLLLISHVLNEIKEENLGSLLKKIESVSHVIWVEPGTPTLSRRLIQIRERLKESFTPLAPCPHSERCGLLSPENDRHWCHFFAPVPQEFFTHSFWGQFSRELKIDIRSLPLSYLVLSKTFPGHLVSSQELGRPRFYKGYGKFLTCTEEGVEDKKILKRDHPEKFR